MKIDKKYIEEFKRVYKKERGEDISDEKAHEMFQNLVLLFKEIYRPVPPPDHEPPRQP